jgi:hypothetical protein
MNPDLGSTDLSSERSDANVQQWISESEGTEYEEEEYSLSSDAQQEWEESLRQLEGLFTMIFFPILGKFLGRRFSHYCKFVSR